MSYAAVINILEVLLLAGVFLFLIRFVFLNYSSRVQKPAAWVQAVKAGRVSPLLLRLEKKYPDRIRFYNLWLQISRIDSEVIEGDLAELGVYKGETAKLIHLCSPQRKLHLFDTFEGFPARDLVRETGKAAGYTTMHFADTSIEKVRQYLGAHPNMIFHRGYFPETAPGQEDQAYALVNLDADLNKPTAEGLAYFYQYLSPGGVILVHDYNDDWPGLVQAVDEFCQRIPESIIPVPDADSTVMIVKNKN